MDFIRLDNLRWRLPACDHVKSCGLPPSLRGLVTDTAMLSGQGKTATRSSLRSHSCSSVKSDWSRQAAVHSVHYQACERLREHPAVSFDPQPPVEVPTFVCRGGLPQRKSPCKKYLRFRQFKVHRCTVVTPPKKRKRPTRRLLPNDTCFATLATAMWQAQVKICDSLSATMDRWVSWSGMSKAWICSPHTCSKPAAQFAEVL